MDLDITFSNEGDQSLSQYFDTIESLYTHTLQHTKQKDTMYEVSLTIVDEKMIREINKMYRQKDTVTDVISFAFLDDNMIIYPDDMPIPLGEIYICDQKIYEQAEAYGHSVSREFHFLALHGLLHLLGYDHMTEDDEIAMFQLQDEILEELGYKRSENNG